MIEEVAIDPDALAHEGANELLNLLYYRFGAFEGRMISEFPKKWLREIHARKAKLKPLELKRLEELLKKLTLDKSRYLVRYPRTGEGRDWIERVTNGNSDLPFDRVVTFNRSSEFCMSPDSLPMNFESSFERCRNTPRNAKALSNAIKLLYVDCEVLYIVDQHFSLSKVSFLNSLKTFFIDLRAISPDAIIEIHTSGSADEVTITSCQNMWTSWKSKLRGFPPGSIKVSFWPKNTRHDRYIFTQAGGFKFGHGTDSTDDPDARVEIDLLDRGEWERQYDLVTSSSGVKPVIEYFL